jgi:hypothetical protein
VFSAIGSFLKQDLLDKNNYCSPRWQTHACGHGRLWPV